MSELVCRQKKIPPYTPCTFCIEKIEAPLVPLEVLHRCTVFAPLEVLHRLKCCTLHRFAPLAFCTSCTACIKKNRSTACTAGSAEPLEVLHRLKCCTVFAPLKVLHRCTVFAPLEVLHRCTACTSGSVCTARGSNPAQYTTNDYLYKWLYKLG